MPRSAFSSGHGAGGQTARRGNRREISCIEDASAFGAREPQAPLDGSCRFWKTLAGAGSARWSERPPSYRRRLVDHDPVRWLSLLALRDRLSRKLAVEMRR